MESQTNLVENLDIPTLDRIVDTFYNGFGAEREKAQKLLTQFQEHPDSWQKVDYIIEMSKNYNTKYIALQILEKLIQSRWNVLPREQCEGKWYLMLGIKAFVIGLIIKYSTNEVKINSEKLFVNKLNLILVQILKQDWPKNWPSFISELVSSSRSSLSLCENNMVILKLLSEEVFDFSAEQMTTVKTKGLKNQLYAEFSEIYQLCAEVLEKAQKPSLILATLEALLRFLKWIPLGYIFETNIIQNLKSRFLSVAIFRNSTIACLTEIGSLATSPEYDDKFVFLFQTVMESMVQVIPFTNDLNLAKMYHEGNNEDQKYVQNLAMFLTTFFATHLKTVENMGNREALILGFQYLLKISLVDDREVFKVCLEFWNKFVSGLYAEYPFSHVGETPLMLGSIIQTNSRRSMYIEILSSLRHVMIQKMVKPEEVLVVEDENGEVVREHIKETDTITLYKSMRECLVYLTHLDCEDTELIMTEKLSRQFDGSEWSWGNLNKLCWAIGSISGAMNEETEKKFLVAVIRDLLGLCEMKRGKDNKAIVASNIMYIVGQYPRFLKAHWKFLKTVVNKLFEFMHETHEGVQDMACDTFIKIAQKCRNHFVILQKDENLPFLDEIIESLSTIIGDLQPSQVHTFYEALGYMVQAQKDPNVAARQILSMMALPNQIWDSIISAASKNMAILQSSDNIKQLSSILKTNISACSSVGPAFITQLGKIYMDMLSLYKAISGIVSESVRTQGLIATKTPLVRGLRGVKKDILRLVDAFIVKAEDIPMVSDSLSPPLFEAILNDYKANVEPARDSEVLAVTATIISKCKERLCDKIPAILDAVFECTLNMINKDFSEYPDLRANFFKLIAEINANCFDSLLRLPPTQFKLIIDSVVWAFKHTHRDIAETGLNICLDLLNNVEKAASPITNAFYQTYFLTLLQDVFYVLTDTDHKSGFKLQSSILAHFFGIVESGKLTAPLFNIGTNAQFDNKAMLSEYVVNLLKNAFPHLQKSQLETFVKGLFDLNKDITTFKLHLRDFLIQLKEFSGDNAELFLEEFELEQERKKKAEMDAAMRVPGIIKPHDKPDEFDD